MSSPPPARPKLHRPVDPARLDRHGYQIAHLMAGFTVPLMRHLYRQFDGDMVQILVLGEISLHNVARFFRQGGAEAPEKLLDDEARRAQLMQPCNVLSISEATGIPRETVRRKVETLIANGWLERDEQKRLYVKRGAGEAFVQRNARAVQEVMALAARIQALLDQPDDGQD